MLNRAAVYIASLDSIALHSQSTPHFVLYCLLLDGYDSAGRRIEATREISTENFRLVTYCASHEVWSGLCHVISLPRQ